MDDEAGITSTLAASSGATASPAGSGTRVDPSSLTKEEIVRILFDAFNRREVEEALSLLDPDVVFQPMTAQVTQAGEPYCGHEGIRRYAADVEEQWDELTLHPTQIRTAGEAVVALGLVSGVGHAGSFADAPTTWMFKFRDGLVWQAQIFSEERNVFEALGGEDG